MLEDDELDNGNTTGYDYGQNQLFSHLFQYIEQNVIRNLQVMIRKWPVYFIKIFTMPRDL